MTDQHPLPAQAREWLQQPSFAFLATVMEDGSPHVSPVWIHCDDDYVLVNTAEGRVKAANLHRDNRVALSLSPVGHPYQHLDIRGRVVELIGGEEAARHITELHRKYHGGTGEFPLKPGEQRLKVVIEPVAIWVAN